MRLDHKSSQSVIKLLQTIEEAEKQRTGFALKEERGVAMGDFVLVTACQLTAHMTHPAGLGPCRLSCLAEGSEEFAPLQSY